MLVVEPLDRFNAATGTVGDLFWRYQYWFTIESDASVRGLSLELFHPEEELVIEALRIQYRKAGHTKRTEHVVPRDARSEGSSR